MSALDDYRKRDPNPALARKLTVGVWVVTGVVFVLVGVMRRIRIEVAVDFGFLPPIHAVLNSCAALALVLALIAIKGRRIDWHKRWVSVAMGCSFLFLLSYVTYHFTTPETIFGDSNRDGDLQNVERKRWDRCGWSISWFSSPTSPSQLSACRLSC